MLLAIFVDKYSLTKGPLVYCIKDLDKTLNFYEIMGSSLAVVRIV